MTKGETTRQRIIEAAAPIFNQRGFAGCSMQELMDATQLEKGGIYRHFRSKEELAAEAFRYALEQSIKTRTEDLAHIEGALAKLHAIVERFVEHPSPLPGGCPLLNTAVDADDGNPELRKLVRKAFADWRGRIAEIVAKGLETKELRPGTDPAQVANTLIATLEGAQMLARLDGSRQALRDARTGLDLFLDSLRPRPSEEFLSKVETTPESKIVRRPSK